MRLPPGAHCAARAALEPERFARRQLPIIAAMGSPATPSSRFELLELNRQTAQIALASPGGTSVHAVPKSGGVAYEDAVDSSVTKIS